MPLQGYGPTAPSPVTLENRAEQTRRPCATEPPTQASSRRRRRRAFELLRACVGSSADSDAWTELNDRFARRFESRLILQVHSLGIELGYDEPQELRQELMIRLFTCEHPFSGRTDEEFWSYINSSVRHLAVDFARFLRAKRRRFQRRNATVGSSDLCRVPRSVYILCSREPDPESVLLRQELHLHLVERVSAVFPDRPSHLDAAVLTLICGLTSREASDELHGALNPKQIDYLLRRLRDAADLPDFVFQRRVTSPGPRLYSQCLAPSLRVRWSPHRDSMLSRDLVSDPSR